MSGPPLEIHVDDNVKLPIAHKPRPVPLHWEADAYKGLLQDEGLGVIERVPYGSLLHLNSFGMKIKVECLLSTLIIPQ